MFGAGRAFHGRIVHAAQAERVHVVEALDLVDPLLPVAEQLSRLVKKLKCPYDSCHSPTLLRIIGSACEVPARIA